MFVVLQQPMALDLRPHRRPHCERVPPPRDHAMLQDPDGARLVSGMDQHLAPSHVRRHKRRKESVVINVGCKMSLCCPNTNIWERVRIVDVRLNALLR